MSDEAVEILASIAGVKILLHLDVPDAFHTPDDKTVNLKKLEGICPDDKMDELKQKLSVCTLSGLTFEAS